ncbi:MAG: hypothetical protein GY820_17190 [Gammaproteobacteria bacterium]|nr:hypothetical protein [Gammaproteobacteria bacterium]
MPPIIDQLLTASFRGVTFSVRSESQAEGGRKIVLHEYPNSADRYAEDLGKIPPRFSVRAFVSGQDFIARGRSLQAALDEEGSGRLVLPTFGAFDVTALSYSKDSNQNSVGEISYTLQFAVSSANAAPINMLSTVQTVFSLGDDARGAIESELVDLWQDAVQKANKIVSEYDLEEIASSVATTFETTTDSSAANDLNNSVDNILRNSGRYVSDGEQLSSFLVQTGSDDITGLFQATSIGQVGGSGYSAAISLLDFGSDLTLQLTEIGRSSTVFSDEEDESRAIPLWPATTADRITRNENRTTLVDTTRLNALIVAFEQAAASEYSTSDEIVEVRTQLEDSYDQLINQDGYDGNRIVGRNSVRNATENLRFATLEVLETKEQDTYQIVDVENIGMPSVPVLTWNLYAENLTTEEDFDLITQTVRTLNPEQSSISLDNEATVLQGSK